MINRMIFLNKSIQSKSSIEESDNLSSDVSFSALLMSEDSLGGREDEMAELSGGEDVVAPFFKVGEEDIVSGWDDTAFVDTADQFNYDLLASVVIDDLEFSDVVVFLHDFKEFKENFGDGSEKDLLLSFSFGIDDSLESVSKDIDFNHTIIK